jgi:hypothetical protein
MRNSINIPRWIATLALFGASTLCNVHAQDKPAASHAGHKKTQLAIGAAFSPAGELWIVSLNEQSRLTIQTSNDDGKSWNKLRILDTGTDQIAAAGEARPKLAFGPAGLVIIAYTKPLAKPYTGEIRMLRSSDGGVNFSQPFTVHQDRQVITHRFESIAFDGKGNLHTVWIDKRDGEAYKNNPAHAKSIYRGAAIYRNVSTDGGVSFGPDLKLAEHSCECCRIGLAPTPEGNIVAMWRHVFAPNIRDHAFAPLTGTTAIDNPQRATFDGWKLDACPHHGPSITPAVSGGYHAVWFGDQAGLVQVRYGKLDQNGAPAGKPIALPDERAEHADIMSADKKVAIIWRSFDGTGTELKAWLSDDDGQTFKLKQLSRTTEENDYPLLVRKDSQIFAVWRSLGKMYVEAL